MICFQSLIFDFLNHYPRSCCNVNGGCDLLSIIDLWLLEPLVAYFESKDGKLWFAFNHWSLTSWTTIWISFLFNLIVVICFQSLIFDFLNHYRRYSFPLLRCCDLLSIIDLWLLEPLSDIGHDCIIGLWFAFNHWSLTSWTTIGGTSTDASGVVICFQSLIFDFLNHSVAFRFA